MQVREVMTTEVYTIRPTDSIRRAARLLAEHGVGGMPVLDGDGLVGVISETDILETLKTQHKKLRMLMPPEISFGIRFVEVLEDREAHKVLEDIGDRTVADIMTREVVTVAPTDPIERAIQIMVKHRVHRLPVVDEGRVVGVVTRGDVLRAFFRSLAEEGTEPLP